MRRRGDLYLLMNIDVPWVPDPRRDRGDRREEMDELFRAMLEKHGLPYVTVSGSWRERTDRAVNEATRVGGGGRRIG
jgi:HTH-type transcriptional repressor of NAD biosynthesis genes